MHYSYLIDYLKDHTTGPYRDLLDALKYELDQNIYYYGDQFKYPKERYSAKSMQGLKRVAKRWFVSYKIIRNQHRTGDKKNILSNAYFTVNEELKKLDYRVFCPSWNMAADKNVLTDMDLFVSSERIKVQIQNSNFNRLVSHDFLSEVQQYKEQLRDFYKRTLNALVVPNDMSFFENLSIRVCRELQIPSFVFLHGLPGRYNGIDDNRSDYLLVWGDKIKENYIRAGMDADKIMVSGHPYYKEFSERELKFSLENILIITKAMSGSQHSDKIRLGDRGNLVLYLCAIENTLKRLGVKSVRFRPHPSENADWYLKFINTDFFHVDRLQLNDSISSASLIIGPASTVFLESIYRGVNYTVFEPLHEGMDLFQFNLVPPFDGSDTRIPVAKNEEELYYLLKSQEKVKPSFFREYIKTPFSLDFIQNLIK